MVNLIPNFFTMCGLPIAVSKHTLFPTPTVTSNPSNPIRIAMIQTACVLAQFGVFAAARRRIDVGELVSMPRKVTRRRCGGFRCRPGVAEFREFDPHLVRNRLRASVKSGVGWLAEWLGRSPAILAIASV